VLGSSSSLTTLLAIQTKSTNADDGCDTDRHLAVELAAADRLLRLLVLQRTVGLLTFAFLGTHRSGRLSVPVASSRALPGSIVPVK
jgi:hypothetical protein